MKIAGELGMEDRQSAPGLLSPATRSSTAGDVSEAPSQWQCVRRVCGE